MYSIWEAVASTSTMNCSRISSRLLTLGALSLYLHPHTHQPRTHGYIPSRRAHVCVTARLCCSYSLNDANAFSLSLISTGAYSSRSSCKHWSTVTCHTTLHSNIQHTRALTFSSPTRSFSANSPSSSAPRASASFTRYMFKLLHKRLGQSLERAYSSRTPTSPNRSFWSSALALAARRVRRQHRVACHTSHVTRHLQPHHAATSDPPVRRE